MIECARHGRQPETFVCQHLVVTLHTRLSIGFHWPRATRDSRPNAWCSDCETRVKATNGEWIGDAAKHLGASLLCAACYDEVRRLNLGENRDGAA